MEKENETFPHSRAIYVITNRIHRASFILRACKKKSRTRTAKRKTVFDLHNDVGFSSSVVQKDTKN